MSHMNSLVVIEQQDDELSDLRAEVEQLTARSERITAEYVELDEAMRSTVDTLESEMPAYKSLFDTTMEELIILRQQQRVLMEARDAREAAMRAERAEQEGYAGESDDDDDDDDEAGFAESMKARWRAQREGRQHGSSGPAGRGSSRNPRHESLTKMFRRLANLCHPDKTDDPYLQGLFAKGMEAREAANRAALADLLLSAELHANGTVPNQDTEALKERLREQKAQLEVRVRHTERRVTGLGQTPLGKIHHMYTSTSDSAKVRSRSSFKKILMERITQMDSEATGIREWLIMSKETPSA